VKALEEEEEERGRACERVGERVGERERERESERERVRARERVKTFTLKVAHCAAVGPRHAAGKCSFQVLTPQGEFNVSRRLWRRSKSKCDGELGGEMVNSEWHSAERCSTVHGGAR